MVAGVLVVLVAVASVGAAGYHYGYIDDLMVEEVGAKFHQVADPIATAAVRHSQRAQQYMRSKVGLTKHFYGQLGQAEDPLIDESDASLMNEDPLVEPATDAGHEDL
jgi:hypothetical protein